MTSDDVRTVVDNLPSCSVEDHYDMASALVKSMRGSDVDASIYWATRMLEAGEDPQFIARRVIVCAAEDVGMAQPQALQTAVSAAQAAALVGMPDARVPLLEAVIAVAIAPKSDAVLQAALAAKADIAGGKLGIVPMHLRSTKGFGDSSTSASTDTGYRNPHDFGGFVRQQYLPYGIEDAQYYHPKHSGMETKIAPWLEQYREASQSGQTTAD